ncbi:MAG: hypothetical protein WB503_03340, partial [Pseudolabrys sp.]
TMTPETIIFDRSRITLFLIPQPRHEIDTNQKQRNLRGKRTFEICGRRIDLRQVQAIDRPLSITHQT